ncbi:hypothetical protein BDV59DRAFT_185761 [Aspergillus ambiguus]|uniref:uncharacterized protein n=1 Tax=Aspergillus ambiguus TaxID=176160 RepID=UPI003CCCB8BD
MRKSALVRRRLPTVRRLSYAALVSALALAVDARCERWRGSREALDRSRCHKKSWIWSAWFLSRKSSIRSWMYVRASRVSWRPTEPISWARGLRISAARRERRLAMSWSLDGM